MNEAAIVSEDEVTELSTTEKGWVLPLRLLSVQEGFNVRENTEPDKELLSSIEAQNILRPIHIRNNPDKEGHYFVVDGERRFNCAKKLKFKTVPVISEGDMSDVNALVLSLVTNDGHRDLSPREIANAFRKLKEAGVGESDIATAMGFEIRKVKETLRVLEQGDEELVEAVTAADKKERIPPRAAARAASLPKPVQKKVAKEMKGKNVNEGLKVVRREEKKLGVTKKRGRKANDYELGPNVKKNCQLLEAAVKATLKDKPNNTRSAAHMEVINVLKGKLEITELYPDMLKSEGKATKDESPKKGAKNIKVAKKGGKKIVK